MHATCPNCNAKLKDFAFSCQRCGWSLDGQIEQARSATVAAPEPVADETLAAQPTAPGLLFERANQAIESGDYASATRDLNRAIVDAPVEQLGELYALRGYAHLKSGNFSQAELDCDQALTRLWVRPQTYAWRAAARGETGRWREAFDDLAMACEVAGDQRDPYLQLMETYAEAASEHFRQIIKEKREDADVFFDRGWIYYRVGRASRAERDFRFALKMDPRHSAAALGLAKVLHQSKTPDRESLKQIIDLCTIAVESGDDDCQLDALHVRASANYSVGHFARAAKDLSQLSEKCKDDSARMVRCGDLRCELEQYVEAISDYSGALELDPELHLALQRRADCYVAIRNYPLAIDDLTRFLRVYTDDIDARVARGQAYLKRNRPDLALVDFDRVLESDSTSVPSLLGRAEIFTRRKQLDLALTECEKAIRLDNRNHSAFAVLGEVYTGLCDYGRAVEEYSRAVSLAPTDQQKAESLYRRGTAYYEMEDFASARQDFSQSVELRPRHPGAWIWNSAACSRLEDWPTAIVSLENAVSARPSLARQYLALGKPVAQQAVEFFRNELQRGRKTASSYRSLGLAWHFLGQHELAVRNYTDALALEKDDEATLMRRGRALMSMKDFDNASDDFTAIIHSNSDNHQARFHRAETRAARARNRVALMDVIKAIKQFPGNPVYHVLHADLLQKPDATGKPVDWSKVVRAYDRAIRIDSSDPEVLHKRGQAAVQDGRLLSAVNDYSRALELDPARTDILIQRGNTLLKDQKFDSALADFEFALTQNQRQVKACTGRALALASLGRHEYSLIWLTKQMHRFDSARELAEVLFTRGKVFCQMKRFHPAINDFSSVIDLLNSDQRAQIPARIARGIAWIQIEQPENSIVDFRSVVLQDPDNPSALTALAYLENPSKPKPPMFAAPPRLIRPTKPSVATAGSEFEEIDEAFNALPPFDSWILRVRRPSKNGSSEKEVREFGPVPKRTVESWASEGRIDAGMKLLRADWSRWEQVENIIPVLKRKLKTENEFPSISVRTADPSIGSDSAAEGPANPPQEPAE